MLLSLAIILLLSNGCAGMKMPTRASATLSGVSGYFRAGQIVDLKGGNVLSFDELIAQIASKDLVFIGEVHDNPEHHLIQVQILQALIDCCSPVTFAMEFLQKPDQEFVDQYLRGTLSEEEFLKKADWAGGWGYDYHLYRPIFLLTKQNGNRILALNAPHESVKKVARNGLQSLDPVERHELAREIDLSDEAHHAYLREIYDQHSHNQLKQFDYFYEAQCAWEDTMAQNLAEFLRETANKVVALTGNGHIVNKFGIPNRVIRRFPVSLATIMPYPIHENTVIKRETADYIWFTHAYPRRRHAH